MRTRVKWAVNKAAKLGVVVRPAETKSELREWYGLYLDTMRRSTIPPRPYRFFCALWDILKPQGTMQLLIAERQGRILAGSIFLKFGNTVSYAFNGSCRKDLSLRPNDAIQWHAINEACRNGCRSFDFGEVPEEHHELAHFKSKWGAKPTRLYRFSSSPPDGLSTAADYPRGRAVSLAASAWRRLPIKATEWLGDRVYSYL
jgi:lipid II:glycine glycyltransferase (peptidoglycan interpeptide bridge formation enzyme)